MYCVYYGAWCIYVIQWFRLNGVLIQPPAIGYYKNFLNLSSTSAAPPGHPRRRTLPLLPPTLPLLHCHPGRQHHRPPPASPPPLVSPVEISISSSPLPWALSAPSRSTVRTTTSAADDGSVTGCNRHVNHHQHCPWSPCHNHQRPLHH